MAEIRSLEGLAESDLYAAWSEAFAEYDRSWTPQELNRMLHRRAYVPELSFGAFEQDRLVSFTLNGIGTYNGLETAYDTGTATVKDFRGQGLARRIFEVSLPALRTQGVRQYILEVLCHNTRAVELYKAQGFQVLRQLNYFVEQARTIRADHRSLPQGVEIRRLDSLKPELMKPMFDFSPSWQNSFDAIGRKEDDFVMLGAFAGDRLCGYGLIEPFTGDVPQLAVSRDFRRKGIATALLNELNRFNEHEVLRILNTQAPCESIDAFLRSFGISPKGQQFEMAMRLD